MTDTTQQQFVRHCPYCGHVVVRYEPPQVGDISLCLHCRLFVVFTEDGLRRPTLPELASIANDPVCRAALAAARERSRPGVVIVDWLGKMKPHRGANSGGDDTAETDTTQQQFDEMWAEGEPADGEE